MIKRRIDFTVLKHRRSAITACNKKILAKLVLTDVSIAAWCAGAITAVALAFEIYRTFVSAAYAMRVDLTKLDIDVRVQFASKVNQTLVDMLRELYGLKKYFEQNWN
jgi:hypothetical protein